MTHRFVIVGTTYSSKTYLAKQTYTSDYRTCKNNDQQVSAEPPLSALNITLPAFAAESRRLQHGAPSAPACSYRSIFSEFTEAAKVHSNESISRHRLAP